LKKFQVFWQPHRCPTAATYVLFNSTYKLGISTDTIVEIQVTKLLTKLLAESHWQIFSRF